MRKGILSLGVLLMSSLASAASAQVIYEPVRYEYQIGNDYKFYYGGDNPRVFEYAARSACLQEGREGVREGRYGVGYLHQGLIGSPPYRVFTDCAPYVNAAVYGFTPADAHNEAYTRLPRYFTKASLLATAVPATDPGYYQKATPDGIPADGSRVLVVAARGWPAPDVVPGIEIRRTRGPASRPSTAPSTAPATRPATLPKPLMIIPKRLLEQPLKESDKSVAAAQ